MLSSFHHTKLPLLNRQSGQLDFCYISQKRTKLAVKVMGKAQLIDYLRGELAISNSAIAVALRHGEQDATQLPMVLWQYGLVTLEQLNLIFDWLQTQPT